MALCSGGFSTWTKLSLNNYALIKEVLALNTVNKVIVTSMGWCSIQGQGIVQLTVYKRCCVFPKFDKCVDYHCFIRGSSSNIYNPGRRILEVITLVWPSAACIDSPETASSSWVVSTVCWLKYIPPWNTQVTKYFKQRNNKVAVDRDLIIIKFVYSG